MADKTTTTSQIALEFTLQNGGNQTSRTITFDTQLPDNSAKGNVIHFTEDYLANYKYGIQPTGWRDSDDEEEAYECTAIKAKRINKTEIEYDLGY